MHLSDREVGVNKLLFYGQRVKVMSPSEIIYRIRWKTKQKVHNRIKKASLDNNEELAKIKALPTLEQFKKEKKGNFFFEKKDTKNNLTKNEIIKEYKENFSLKALLQEADQLCKHKIPLYDLKKSLGTSINWNKDYKTGQVWPQKYVGKLHHADPNYGFVRYVWELNRHSFLPVLARAFYLSGDDKYAQKVLSLIEDWIKQNPYLETINWFSGLELAIRIINWIWSLKFIRNYDKLSEERFNKIVQNIYLQYDTIIDNLSFYSSANNHLTGELAGLKLITTIFSYFKNAAEWNKKSTQLLKKDTLQQIYEDGTGAEQSSNYLLFTLNLYLQAFIVTESKLPFECKKKFQNAGQFLLALSTNREQTANFGDSDDAHPVDLLDQKHNKIEALLNSLAILYSNGEFKSYSKTIDEQSFWIFGVKGTEKYNKIKVKKRVEESKLFDKGGYLISQSKQASLIFDCGPLGYLEPAGHGHCDALSILFSAQGKDFLIDPGTYVYQNDKEWRCYFKSTPAHNTLTIDQKNQSKIKGDFIYGKKAEVNIEKFILAKDTDMITASHNGYENIGVIHQREIVHHKINKEITIVDTLKTAGQHDCSIFFNLHPQVKVKREQNKFILERDNTKITLILDDNLEVQQYRGSLKPLRGWYSPSFGVKEPAVCLEGKIKIKRDTEIKSKVEY